jgi:DMSO/TMAO reductase YedYZ molybdopterin-dependent catalytic subunit
MCSLKQADCSGDFTLHVGSIPRFDPVAWTFQVFGLVVETRFGGPLRLIVPKKYAYKSAKWVRKVKFTEQQELRYWELRGYSNTADPCREDRYAV